MALSTTINYDTAGNFTYDSATTEFSGSTVRLKDITPANHIFTAFYSSDSNGSWGDGSMTATETGTPTVSGGLLTLSGAEQVSYDAASNVAESVGTIRLKVTPNYSGSPSTDQYILRVETTSSSNDYIEIKHGTSGSISFILRDEAAVEQVNKSGSWSPTAGTEYDIEINYDGVTGASAIYVDGSRKGIVDTSSFTRSMGANTNIKIGHTSTSQDFSVSAIVCYDAVQHTDAFTPGALPTETRFTSSTSTPPVVTVNSAIRTDSLESFSASTSTSGSDSVTFVIRVDGTDKYWDGSAWSDSDLTLAQSNTAADINTNAASLTMASTGSDVIVKALLYSAGDNSNNPTATSATVGYSFASAAPSAPTECIIYGDIRDLVGDLEGVSAASIVAELTVIMFYGDNVIRPSEKVGAVDSSGSFELSLVETASGGTSVSGGAVQYKFSLRYTDTSGTTVTKTLGNATVPNQSTQALTSLTFS